MCFCSWWFSTLYNSNNRKKGIKMNNYFSISEESQEEIDKEEKEEKEDE